MGGDLVHTGAVLRVGVEELLVARDDVVGLQPFLEITRPGAVAMVAAVDKRRPTTAVMPSATSPRQRS